MGWDQEGRSEEGAGRPFRAVDFVEFTGCWVVLFEGGGDSGAPGSLGVGGVAEEGVGWGGEEVGVVVGEGYVV